MTEAALLNLVLSLAEKYDVLAFHAYDSRKTYGPGFPDIVLSSPYSTLFAELKIDDTAKGYLKPEQRQWRDNLISSGEQWVLWRPRNYFDGTIELTIKELCNES